MKEKITLFSLKSSGKRNNLCTFASILRHIRMIRNKYFWLLLLLSLVNLLVMHYSIITTCEVENPLLPVDYVDNFGFVTIEVILAASFFGFVLGGRMKMAALLTFLSSWLWSFCNIVYSRFFYQYIPFSALSESDSMLDPIVIHSLVNGFRWADLYFVISLLLALLFFRKMSSMRLHFTSLKYTVVGILSVILTGMVAHWVLQPTFSPRVYFGVLNYELFRTWRYTCRPLYTNFQRGTLRSMSYAVYEELLGSQELTPEQEQQITSEVDSLRMKQISGHQLPSDVKNIIILLVESYMSLTVDMKVNGQEVTPFLNSLVRDSSVYFNGHMASNITCGESSDGQFIYMTGLLPLRSEITITKAKRNVLPALPILLKKERGMHSRMVIPTAAAMWSQDAMCKAYGIEELHSVNEYLKPHGSCLSDDQVVELADSVDLLSKQPFFSTVLTFSMHMPYTEMIDPTFKTDGVTPADFACYLNACHFTDKNIRSYFEKLKRNGLYDKSMIVIVADHHVSENALTLPSTIKEREELPVFIINGGIDRKSAWNGKCNQLDVYTTILDILGIKVPWLGFGHTLLTTSYQNSLPQDSPKWDYSDWIIQSDWFSTSPLFPGSMSLAQ